MAAWQKAQPFDGKGGDKGNTKFKQSLQIKKTNNTPLGPLKGLRLDIRYLNG